MILMLRHLNRVMPLDHYRFNFIFSLILNGKQRLGVLNGSVGNVAAADHLSNLADAFGIGEQMHATGGTLWCLFL